jgi:hypothetical protein
MADEGATTTVEKPDVRPAVDDQELGEKGVKALEAMKQRAREAEAWRKENEPLVAKAREAEEASKSEAQKAAERAAQAEREAGEAKGMALRYEVAAEAGLPLKMARRLHGSTKEELEEDARDLLETLGKPGEQKPRSNGNAGTEGAAPGGSMSDALRGAFRNGRTTITT